MKKIRIFIARLIIQFANFLRMIAGKLFKEEWKEEELLKHIFSKS